MNGNLKLRGVTTGKDKFSFLLWNCPRQPYFLDHIRLNWWFKYGNNKKYHSLRIINRWINESIFEFNSSYFDLEPNEILKRIAQCGKDIRDILRLEVQVYYYREKKRGIIKCQML